jgi:hypothetical protein
MEIGKDRSGSDWVWTDREFAVQTTMPICGFFFDFLDMSIGFIYWADTGEIKRIKNIYDQKYLHQSTPYTRAR